MTPVGGVKGPGFPYGSAIIVPPLIPLSLDAALPISVFSPAGPSSPGNEAGAPTPFRGGAPGNVGPEEEAEPGGEPPWQGVDGGDLGISAARRWFNDCLGLPGPSDDPHRGDPDL